MLLKISGGSSQKRVGYASSVLQVGVGSVNDGFRMHTLDSAMEQLNAELLRSRVDLLCHWLRDCFVSGDDALMRRLADE